MLVYVVEAFVVWRLSRRVRSLVFAEALFWLTLGWLLDLVAYGWLLSLSPAYLTLLVVKQFFNAVLNALVAELGLLALGTGPLVRSGSAAPVPLRDYIFARIVFLVMLLGLPLGLLATRASYDSRIQLFESVGDEAPAELRATLVDYLDLRREPLEELAQLVEIDWARSGAAPSARLAAFLAARPAYFNVGLTNAAGDVLDLRPPVDARGAPIARGNLAHRSYFRAARAERRTAFGELILGTLHVRDPERPEPVLLVAAPLLAPDGGFAGALVAALDAAALRPLLADHRDRRAEREVSYTLVDQAARVIASLSPRLAPGSAFELHLPGFSVSATRRGLASYPSPDASQAAAMEIDRRLARTVALGAPPWTLVRDAPADLLYAEVARGARWALAFSLGALGLLYLVVTRALRGVTRSLRAVGTTVEAVAEDRTDAAARIAELAQSPILELRRVAEQASTLVRLVSAQRRGAADAPAAGERRLRAILEHSRDLFYAHTPDHVLTYVSPQSRSSFDCEPEEARVSWTELDSDHPVNRAGYEHTARAIATGQRQPPFELEVVGREGRKLWVEVDEAPVVENGRLVEVVGALTDITARKRAESERDRMEQQLRQVQKLEAVGRLAGGIAHDFHNLLGVIQGYAELLAEDPELPAAQRAFAGELRQAAEKGVGLTRQLRAFSRRQVLRPKLLDLDRALGESEKLLRRLLGERWELHLELGAAPAAVLADPGRLDQVVLNLALNARDATPDGGRVTLCTRRLECAAPFDLAGVAVPPGDYVVLEMVDRGAGTDAETRERLFEPFFTTKELGHGAGLGLATVYGIVKQSGGYIAVESASGRGATFTVLLPRARAEAAAAPAPPSRPLDRSARDATVLVVEDDPRLRELTRQQVESFGYRVLTAGSGSEALAVARAGAIDLLLTDVVMPKLSGWELADRLRATRPELRVVFVSGYPHDQLGWPAPLDPAARLLTKPVARATLAAALAEALGGAPSAQRTLA